MRTHNRQVPAPVKPPTYLGRFLHANCMGNSFWCAENFVSHLLGSFLLSSGPEQARTNSLLPLRGHWAVENDSKPVANGIMHGVDLRGTLDTKQPFWSRLNPVSTTRPWLFSFVRI